MKIECYNSEPDGRLVIKQNDCSIIVPVDYIDKFIKLLQQHSSSEGDSEGFVFNRKTLMQELAGQEGTQVTKSERSSENGAVADITREQLLQMANNIGLIGADNMHTQDLLNRLIFGD